MAKPNTLVVQPLAVTARDEKGRTLPRVVRYAWRLYLFASSHAGSGSAAKREGGLWEMRALIAGSGPWDVLGLAKRNVADGDMTVNVRLIGDWDYVSPPGQLSETGPVAVTIRIETLEEFEE